jgi:hypothetical protein
MNDNISNANKRLALLTHDRQGFWQPVHNTRLPLRLDYSFFNLAHSSHHQKSEDALQLG